jgi:hypothetical protein
MAKGTDDEFDLAACRLTPELAANLQPGKKLLPARREIFVQLPYKMALTVAVRRDASSAVLIELAYQAFKTHRNPVPLTNVALRAVGVSSDAKVRALRRLEADGIVSVDWRGGRKTPLVMLRWTT